MVLDCCHKVVAVPFEVVFVRKKFNCGIPLIFGEDILEIH